MLLHGVHFDTILNDHSRGIWEKVATAWCSVLSSRDLHSSGMLSGVICTYSRSGTIHQGWSTLGLLGPEDGTNRLSWNVGNYQSALRNIPEERRSDLFAGGSQKLRVLSSHSRMNLVNRERERAPRTDGGSNSRTISDRRRCYDVRE
jgi:hypothetical protein